MSPERETWDEKLGRGIRRFFAALWPRPNESIDDWERHKMEAWDEEENQARDVLRDRRDTRGR